MWVVWKAPGDTKYSYQRIIEYEVAKQSERDGDLKPSVPLLETFMKMLIGAIVSWNLTDPDTGEALEPPSKNAESLDRLPTRIVQNLVTAYMEEMGERAEIPLGPESN